jgi:hypothetical protein
VSTRKSVGHPVPGRLALQGLEVFQKGGWQPILLDASGGGALVIGRGAIDVCPELAYAKNSVSELTSIG